MTIAELRKHPDYKKAVEKVRGYRKGFKFTMNYADIPTAKGNALKVVLHDCVNEKLLESVSFGLALDGTVTDETFVRI